MIKSLVLNKHLAYNLVIGDIKSKYFGSFTGFFGSILNPLLTLLIYTFVFSGILKIKFGLIEGMANFAIYLFCGLLPWLGFSEAVQRSSTVMLDQRSLIKRTKFPKIILPFYLTCSAFINQLFALLAFLTVLIITQYMIQWPFFLLILIFPAQILFTFGCCLIVSVLNIFFRDIGIFLATFLQLWFFCTPIFYPETLIPERFLPILKINPLFHLVKIYRSTLLDGNIPPFSSVIWFIFFTVLSTILGFVTFQRVEEKIVDFA